jgi:hypothetical protein
MAQHTYNTVPTQSEEKVYRLKVVENTQAALASGTRVWPVHVRETFGRGFTVGLPAKLAKKIKTGQRYELRYDERRIEVRAEVFAPPEGDESRLILATIREHEPTERWAFRLPFTKGTRVISYESSGTSAVAYGGFVLVLFCVLSLPGLGDRLGTAPRIEAAVKLISRNVADVVENVRER